MLKNSLLHSLIVRGRILVIYVGMILCSNNSHANTGDKIKISADRAIHGSINDIENMIRYYENCNKGMTNRECEDKLNYWADIGAYYGNIGALTIVVNRDIDSKRDCIDQYKIMFYIEKIRAYTSKIKSIKVYRWNRERNVMVNRIKKCISVH